MSTKGRGQTSQTTREFGKVDGRYYAVVKNERRIEKKERYRLVLSRSHHGKTI